MTSMGSESVYEQQKLELQVLIYWKRKSLELGT